MKRSNSMILSLAVALTLAGCSTYHAAYDEPNNPAYPNNSNSAAYAGSENAMAANNAGNPSYAPANPQPSGNGAYSNAENMPNPSYNTANPPPAGNGAVAAVPSDSAMNNGVAENTNPNPPVPANSPTDQLTHGGAENPTITSTNGVPTSPNGTVQYQPGQQNTAPENSAMNSSAAGTTPPSPANAGGQASASTGVNGTSQNQNMTADNNAASPGPQVNDANEKHTLANALTNAERQFIADAHGGNQFEINAGKKALSKSQDPGVKKIAQQMVDDHTKSDEQLSALAGRKGDHDLGGLTSDELDQLSQLDKADGANFDGEYLRQQKAAHEKTIAEFKDQAQNAQDRDLRDWAAATLPTLQGHLNMINQQMNPNIGSER